MFFFFFFLTRPFTYCIEIAFVTYAVCRYDKTYRISYFNKMFRIVSTVYRVTNVTSLPVFRIKYRVCLNFPVTKRNAIAPGLYARPCPFNIACRHLRLDGVLNFKANGDLFPTENIIVSTRICRAAGLNIGKTSFNLH